MRDFITDLIGALSLFVILWGGLWIIPLISTVITN